MLSKQLSQPNRWDKGELAKFQVASGVQGYAVDLLGGGKLVVFTEQYDPRIARETDALLQWLGTPKGFTVNLWWRDDPRRIAANEWPTARTVNGGWTYQNSNSIVVYRSEEWDRVLIHEVIHAMGWDWEMPAKPLSCWKFTDADVLQPALFEAWTELYAEWLWCAWHNVSWDTQYQWQLYQAKQILARQKTTAWVEETNVFAYYVLKAILSPHIGFLWVYGNGRTTEERYTMLCSLVQPELDTLRAEARSIKPEAMSLRMSRGQAPF